MKEKKGTKGLGLHTRYSVYREKDNMGQLFDAGTDLSIAL